MPPSRSAWPSSSPNAAAVTRPWKVSQQDRTSRADCSVWSGRQSTPHGQPNAPPWKAGVSHTMEAAAPRPLTDGMAWGWHSANHQGLRAAGPSLDEHVEQGSTGWRSLGGRGGGPC